MCFTSVFVPILGKKEQKCPVLIFQWWHEKFLLQEYKILI